MEKNNSRRKFIKHGAVGAAGLMLAGNSAFANKTVIASSSVPAILGGKPAWSAANWVKWPIWIPEQDEPLLLQAMRGGAWSRSKLVDQFEKEWAEMLGVKRSLMTCNGTNALVVGLNQLGIGAGDEVLVPPYTFIATIQAVTTNGAMPVFVDVDPNTYQMDPSKIEAKITPRTKAIVPVHILGMPADMDRIMAIAKKHNLLVLEDACQAHLAAWKDKTVGNCGLGGAFSFQASKNLNSGEGGAIISNNTDYFQKCNAFHHQGQSSNSAGLGTGSGTRGCNLRITEFQSAILLAQMTRLKEQAEKRWENAQYLTKMFNEIPGIKPAKLYPGTTRSAYHLYMFRINEKEFGTTREKFIKALAAEGLYASTGYGQMNKGEFIKSLAKEPHYLKIYGEKKMKQWLGQTLNTPVNDRLTNEAVWFTQTTLLGTRTEMEQIAEVLKKVQKNASKL